jgi:dethiobiotin synthetase
LAFAIKGLIPLFRKKGLFITGTDTGVGKTVVAAGLVRLARNAGLNSVAIKPIETGCSFRDGMLYPEDGVFLRQASEQAISLDHCTPFRFSLPASPARAAAMEGKRLFVGDVVEHVRAVVEDVDLTVVEGAGGLMVPIEERVMMIDLIERLGFPTLLVGRMKLGTINHTLLSVEALRSRNIPIAGIVLSRSEAAVGPEEEHTPGDIARLTKDISVVMLPHVSTQIATDAGAIAETMNQAWPQELLRQWFGEGSLS